LQPSETLKNTTYKFLGFLTLGLAILGIPLPVLPTTPFLLLSAWFFARSSETWHQWLLANRTFGPLIKNWEENRSISIQTKIVAISSMVFVGGASVTFTIDNFYFRIFAGLMMLSGCIFILSVKSHESST
jgi:uncharacterized membrane protein YbaN (DUF454 family)